MIKKRKYEGVNNQSLPSHSESQLLKYIAEYNPSVVSFGQYAKTRDDFFVYPLSNTEKKCQKTFGILSEKSNLSHRKINREKLHH